MAPAYLKIKPPDMQRHTIWHDFHPQDKCSYEFANEGEIFQLDRHLPNTDIKNLLKGEPREGIYELLLDLDEGARFSTLLFVSGDHIVEAALWGVGNNGHVSKGYVREVGEEGSLRKYYESLRERFNPVYRKALERVLKERGIIKPKKSSGDKK